MAHIRLRSRIPSAPSSPHESRATSFLRPAVFGGSDGLVSNLALVMGVAGATADNQAIVIAGVAGLLAGAFSMAVGEYVSVRSQHELFESQHRLQERQLKEDKAGERAILEGIYRERGFTDDEARAIVDTLFATPKRALEAMLRDEVGLDPQSHRRSVGSGSEFLRRLRQRCHHPAAAVPSPGPACRRSWEAWRSPSAPSSCSASA